MTITIGDAKIELTDNDLLFDAYLSGAPEKYLNCREFGHPWERTHKGWLVEWTENKGTVYTRELKCSRCGLTKRVDYDPINPKIQLGSARPDYSKVPGYLRPKGDVRMYPRDVSYLRMLREMEEIEQAKRKRRKNRAS